MKKIFNIILAIFLIFSIKNTFASSQNLEDVLNLDIWPANYTINLAKINNFSFKTKALSDKHEKVKNIDKTLKKIIIQKFNNWDFSENKTNSLIKNYSNFVYYVNDFFYYMKIIDNNESMKNNIEVQKWILDSYKNMKIYYKNIFNIIRNPNL